MGDASISLKIFFVDFFWGFSRIIVGILIWFFLFVLTSIML